MCLNPLTLKNFMSNPPYCLPYNLCNVSLENLKLDQQIIPLLIFFLILVTCLLYIILIMKGEILSWSPMGLNPLTPKISLVIFLLPPIQFLWCKFGGFSIGSSYNPPTDIFLHSHNLLSWSLMGVKGLKWGISDIIMIKIFLCFQM